MAIPVVGNVSHGRSIAQQLTLTISHVVATGTDQVLYVAVAMYNVLGVGPASVTYGGVAMTQAHVSQHGAHWLAWYYLENPTVGTANIVVTAPSGTAHSFGMAGYSVTGVPPGSPFRSGITGANGTSTATTVTVASLATDLVLDFTVNYVNCTRTVGAGQTSLYQEDSIASGDYHPAGSSEPGGASTTVMSWTISTSADWGTIAIAIPSVSIPADVRITQVVAETVTFAGQPVQVTQMVVEAVISDPKPIQITQVVVETITANTPGGAGGGGAGAMLWVE